MKKIGPRSGITKPSFPSSNKSAKYSFRNSVHPYGSEWPKISQAIKQRDGYRCRAKDIGLPKCNNKYPPPFAHLLHIHHIIEYNKIRCHNPKYLICLCVDCHHRIHNRLFGKGLTEKQKRIGRKS